MAGTTAGAAAVEITDLQKSIFNVSGTTAPGTKASGPGLTAKPPPGLERAKDSGTPESRGQKRPRDDEDSDGSDGSDGDVAMEEDSDDE